MHTFLLAISPDYLFAGLILLSFAFLVAYFFLHVQLERKNLKSELVRLQEVNVQYQKEIQEKSERLYKLDLQNVTLTTRLEEEKKLGHEKILLLQEAEKKMQDSFKALSLDNLKECQSSFFDMAKKTFDAYEKGLHAQMKVKEEAIDGLVKPLKESLEKVDHKIVELEKARQGAYVGVYEQIKALQSSQVQLYSETANLVKALRAPNIRGMWGEMQLRRVVELSGMVEYCDFITQSTFESGDGKIRPDLIVRLPNSRQIIVDAKTPLAAYLEAVEATSDEQKQEKLKEHARQLKKHLSLLGDKAYFESVGRTPEFVVLFLPGESFFSQALTYDPSLIEYGVERKILLATPTTLIALLRSVAWGWREEKVGEHAEKISELAKALYERLASMVEHFQKLKRSLDQTVDAYNKTVGSFESRVLVSARRFQELGIKADGQRIEELLPVEKIAREPFDESSTLAELVEKK